MKIYLNNLLSRLSEFSSTLDKKENFVDIPWVIIDEEMNHQKIIFKRDGDLIMSLNGNVTIGKWEYLASARSLLLDRIQDKILLNQAFINPGVMVLKLDGMSNKNMVLANEILIPDLDIINYLRDLLYQNKNILTIELKNGKFLEIAENRSGLEKKEVSIDGEMVPDGILEAIGTNKKYQIKNSKLMRVLIIKEYETNHGIVSIEHGDDYFFVSGDLVFKDGNPAPDGRYRKGFFEYFKVKNGRVV